MNARAQYELSAADLATVLAIVRGATLANAGTRLGMDASTVFRAVQRIEKGLGERLFERTRRGYRPTALAQRLTEHAETIEGALQGARAAVQDAGGAASGVVRISAVDAVLNSLVAPALAPLLGRHPRLRIELHADNELTSLTRRDADIALRSTRRPPAHVVGKRIGTMHFAVYASQRLAKRLLKQRAELAHDELASLPWIAIDDAMPEHPGVIWRKHVFPTVQPSVQVNSMLTAAETIEAGIGVGVVALFHARRRPLLAALTATLHDCEIDLWLLTHPESRHLHHIAVVARHLAENLALDE